MSVSEHGEIMPSTFNPICDPDDLSPEMQTGRRAV
jgi:hypothetical protein